MALTQMQLIQSLGEAMAWFEREINWGVKAEELGHLCGRIGELYVAMITNGRMATETNQHGYDVTSSSGERISVKTTAQSGNGGNVSFNPNTLEHVDRVVILRVNTEEMQIETLLDKPISQVRELMRPDGQKRLFISLGRLMPKTPVRGDIKPIIEVAFRGCLIREMETGSIEVVKDGTLVEPVKPILREFALALNISLLNANGNPFNTRQLGSQIIQSIQELNAPEIPKDLNDNQPLSGATDRGES